MLNPLFSKKVQGQKHPGRWGIVEHQIPSIKMFKTNTKSHKHPSIRFLSKSKTQLVNQRKQKVAFSPGTVHSPIERDGVQLRQYWMTLPLYIRPIFILESYAKIAIKLIIQEDPAGGKSTLVQVMVWCHQAPNHFLVQCWFICNPPDISQ